MIGLFFLHSFVLSLQKCTYTSNQISVTDDSSLDDIRDELRPIFLRLTSPGCPYSPSSDKQWTKASKLYPQVDFVTVDCWQNSKICSLFGSSIMTPYHALVLANSTRPLDESMFGNNDDIQESPQKFIDIIQTYANLYPVAPPIINLFPLITDSFYNNVADPIFLLYDSLCSDQVPFLNAWTKVANEIIIPESDNPRIGMIDCSTHFDECQRWMRPYAPKTPIALIYSRATGNFEVLENYNDITEEKIHGLFTNALSKEHREMPTPIPVPDVPVVKPSEDGFKVIKNANLEGRSLDTIRRQYKDAFVFPSSACKDPKNCDTQSLNSVNECPLISPSTEDHENAVKIINFLRNLAGLSVNVSEDLEWSDKCYSTAINIHKIAKVPSNHVIKSEYAVEGYCGESENIEIAANSLLAENSKSVFMSSYKFIIDEGAHNDGVVGHRRYLLHPNLNKIGLGYYPYKEENYGKYFVMKPAVTVLQVISKGLPSYIEDSVPSDLNFISWPPSGPFPIDQLPSNWHISHPDFRKVILSDLKVHIERDDGAELTVKKIYLPNDINKDTLVMQLTQESLQLCQPMRTITVSVFNVIHKKLYRFSFELFSTDDLTELCLYSSDASKCPSSVSQSNKLGPGNYQASIFESTNNKVKVHVVEPITLTEPLSIAAQTRFFFTGEKINGKIEIGSKTIVDFQDPSQTDFSINWSVSSRQIGKLETNKKAKSILVVIIGNTENIHAHDLTFYTGKQTSCSLSIFLYRGESKDVYYNLCGKDGNYYVSVSPTIAYQIYSAVFDNEINNRANVIVLDSIFDLVNQKTNKRVIKVYASQTSKTNPINLSCFLPGKKRDYQFQMFGNAIFECDMNISKYASSIAFYKNDMYGDERKYNFEVYAKGDPYDRRLICPMNFISINGFSFQSTTVSIPYVKGDNDAISAYQPSNNFNLFPNDEYTGGTTISAIPGQYDKKSKCIITTPGVESNYIINFNFDVKKYDPVIIRPAAGTESKQITITLYSVDFKIRVPDTPTTFQAYFENFQDLILDVPTYQNKKSILPAYHFDNCGKVAFKKNDQASTDPVSVDHNITLSDIDYGFIVSTPSVIVADSSNYDANNMQTSKLTVESKTTSTITNIEVKETININSAAVTLDQCTIYENININIKRTEERWPSISLVNTNINPEVVSIDLGITESNSRLLENDEEYEYHILIGGIENDKCESIKNSAQISNIGKFSIECSEDNKQLVAVKGKSNAPILLPEGAITPIPPPETDAFETNILLCNDAFCNIETDGKFSEYTIRLNVAQNANTDLTVSPSHGTESNQVTIKLVDSLGTYTVIPNNDVRFKVYFTNYKDLIVDNPVTTNGVSFVNCYEFHGCEKVTFINQEEINENEPVQSDESLSFSEDSTVDFGIPVSYPSCTVSQSGTYVTPNIQTKKLEVPFSVDSTHVQLKITESIKLDSSSVTLRECKLNDGIEVTLQKSQNNWPTVSLDRTKFNPKSILIDLMISKDTSLLLIKENEVHSLINGLSSDADCDVILPKSTLKNAGDYVLKCSEDKLSLLAEKQGQNGDNGKGNSKGIIIGVAVGVVLAIIVVIVAVFLIKKRKCSYIKSTDGADDLEGMEEKEVNI